MAAKLPAEPQAQQDASLAAQQALSIVAALDELHAYIMSCGGALGEGWTVLFHEKGSGSTPTYLPPEVSHFHCCCQSMNHMPCTC